MTCLMWRDLSTTDFDNLDKVATLVVLPIGATEQHGPHLPVGTDTYGVEALISGLFCKREFEATLLFLPVIWCSKSNEHIAYPGTISLSRETMASVIGDISDSIIRSGFQRLLLLNWHGGNIDFLAVLARDIHQESGLTTFVINFGSILAKYEPQPDWVDKDSFDIHAGRIETSILLASHPHLVKAIDFEGMGSDFARGRMAAVFKGHKHLIPEGGSITMGWTTEDISIDGVVGNTTGSNAAEGDAYLQFMISYLCDVLPELASFKFPH